MDLYSASCRDCGELYAPYNTSELCRECRRKDIIEKEVEDGNQ